LFGDLVKKNLLKHLKRLIKFVSFPAAGNGLSGRYSSRLQAIFKDRVDVLCGIHLHIFAIREVPNHVPLLQRDNDFSSFAKNCWFSRAAEIGRNTHQDHNMAWRRSIRRVAENLEGAKQTSWQFSCCCPK
jgi:hypothetical protein